VTVDADTLTSSAPLGNQWYYASTQGGSGSAIQGATGSTYVATVTGWYWTQVTLNSCGSDTSNHVYVLITGIEERPESSFVVYPVPNEGNFTLAITSQTKQSFKMQIFNNIGQMVFEMRNVRVDGRYEQQIDLGVIPAGIYTIVLHNDQSTMIKKILVRK
jgi:hypothetical protein